MARETKGTVLRLVEQDKDLLKEFVREAVQQILEAEMSDTVGAMKGQRTSARRGCRSGYYEQPGHARRQARAPGAAGPRRPVVDRSLRAV